MKKPDRLKALKEGIKRGAIRTGQAIKTGTVAVGKGFIKTGQAFGKTLKEEMEYRKQLSQLEKKAYRESMLKGRGEIGEARARAEITSRKQIALKPKVEQGMGFGQFTAPKIDVGGFKSPNVEFGFKPAQTKKGKNPLEWI